MPLCLLCDHGVHIVIMRSSGKRNSFFGLLAGGLLSLFGRTPDKADIADLRRADFPTSTQRLGIRFGERIRDVFRFKWLRATGRTSRGMRNDTEQADEPPRAE